MPRAALSLVVVWLSADGGAADSTEMRELPPAAALSTTPPRAPDEEICHGVIGGVDNTVCCQRGCGASREQCEDTPDVCDFSSATWMLCCPTAILQVGSKCAPGKKAPCVASPHKRLVAAPTMPPPSPLPPPPSPPLPPPPYPPISPPPTLLSPPPLPMLSPPPLLSPPLGSVGSAAPATAAPSVGSAAPGTPGQSTPSRSESQTPLSKPQKPLGVSTVNTEVKSEGGGAAQNKSAKGHSEGGSASASGSQRGVASDGVAPEGGGRLYHIASYCAAALIFLLIFFYFCVGTLVRSRRASAREDTPRKPGLFQKRRMYSSLATLDSCEAGSKQRPHWDVSLPPLAPP